MNALRQSDCFIAVNGPEDGTEFPVIRSPFMIGTDNACAVNPRLDSTVAEMHAMVSVVSEGYVVRSIKNARVYVDGKRVGTLLSRVIRQGGYIQVGNTLFCLECADDGLSRRSKGVGSISDMRYAAGLVVETLGSIALSLWNLFVAIVNRSFSLTGIVIVGAIVVYIFWDNITGQAGGFVQGIIRDILTTINNIAPKKP